MSNLIMIKTTNILSGIMFLISSLNSVDVVTSELEEAGRGAVSSLPAGQVMGSTLDSRCLDGKDHQMPCQCLIELALS
jgi:hypothetical protein